MDKIIIQDLEIYAHHGVFQEETFLGQKFLISMELFLDTRKAGTHDSLEASVSYAEVCKAVEALFLAQNYKLIETCAEKIAESILLQFPLIKEINVTVKKPWAPIGSHVGYVAVQINRSWHHAFLGLGSNMGEKKNNLQQAICALDQKQIRILKTSSFLDTKPVGVLDQDDFLNCVLEIETLFTPTELMNVCLEIEKSLKRERIIHWGPRTIDIDILLYDNLISDDEHVIVPHPQMTNRLFVLAPLSEIAPYKVHPLFKKTILELKHDLEKIDPNF